MAAGTLRYALDWRLRPDVPAGAEAFSNHRNIQPLLWALIVVSLLEIVAAHLLVGFFMGATAAYLVFGLSVLGLLYVVGLVNSLAKLPLLVGPDGVRVRAGTLVDHWLPLERIAGATSVTNCGDLKRPGFLKASLLAYPNVLIELDPPLAVKRPNGRTADISTIGLRPDDGPAFVAAIARAKDSLTEPRSATPGRARD